MPYNLNFPLPLDFMRDSQPLMLQNYTEIPNFISQDHFDFADPNQGKHQWSTYTLQDVNNVQNDDPNSVVLFNATNTATKAIQLFLRTSANALVEFNGINTFNNPHYGYFTLPSGLIIKYMSFNVALNLPPFTNNGQRVLQINWPTEENTRPFNTQLWAAVFPLFGADIPDITGATLTYCVNDISNPNQVLANVWVTALFNNDTRVALGRSVATSQNVFVIALGD
jgi:hypothetical protein